MVLLQNMPEAVLGRDLSVASITEALIAWYFKSEGSSRRIDRSYEPLRDAILLACLKHSADRPYSPRGHLDTPRQSCPWTRDP